jgi:hypothetical protein
MEFVDPTKPYRKSGGMGHPFFRGDSYRAQHNGEKYALVRCSPAFQESYRAN